MLIIYGSMLCRDCVACRKDLDRAGVEYEYRDFADSLANLKAFLALRDSDPQFGPIKEAGGIGIPCIVKEDGEVILEWKTFL